MLSDGITYAVEVVAAVLAIEVASTVGNVARDLVVELGELRKAGEAQKNSMVRTEISVSTMPMQRTLQRDKAGNALSGISSVS